MATSYEIHPSIGIARVGTSTEFFIGPEPDGSPPDRYRDGTGALRRQAARFRVFRCERDDRNALLDAQEVTPDLGTIAWTVHLANRKAAGELFPADPDVPPDQRPRRNPHHQGDRHELVIDPGPRSSSGPNQAAAFDSGQFKKVTVPLGEIRSKRCGRLLVLGGFGRSEFVSDRPSPINDFANNSDWFDDVSDGPVRAVVTAADGATHDATPAWVIVAPPDSAPGITNFVTLYDVARDVAVQRGWLEVPGTPSFTRDVHPILSRPLGYWWVSRKAGQGHGPGRSGDFAARWAELADPTREASDREQIFARLRDPHKLPPSTRFTMPRLKAAVGSTDVLPPTRTQWAILERWVAGTFVGDWGAEQPTAELLPDALDRVSLQACSGGAFSPGIEAGRIMAREAGYSEPFRLDAAALEPGAVTEGNAVPWQADFYLCRLEHDGLGWWPAQRPDQVFPDLAAVDSLASQDWARGVTSYEGMVENWHRLGVVAERPGPDGGPVFLETERSLPEV